MGVKKETGTRAASTSHQVGFCLALPYVFLLLFLPSLSLFPQLTGHFEVSTIEEVRAACPVCDPVSSIYGPVQDGSGLPFLPVIHLRPWSEGRSVHVEGLPRMKMTDWWCLELGSHCRQLGSGLSLGQNQSQPPSASPTPAAPSTPETPDLLFPWASSAGRREGNPDPLSPQSPYSLTR